MQRSTPSSRRFAVALAISATAVAYTGCTDSVAPAPRAVSPNSIIIIGGRTAVLNAQLRGIGNPNDKLAATVAAHLQLKLDGSAETGYVIDWKVDVATLDLEAARLFGGGIYSIQDSEDFPNPFDVPLAYLLPPEDPLGTRPRGLEGSVAISEELASRLVTDPEDFTAVFFLDGGGAIAGTLQLGGPDTAPTR